MQHSTFGVDDRGCNPWNGDGCWNGQGRCPGEEAFTNFVAGAAVGSLTPAQLSSPPAPDGAPKEPRPAGAARHATEIVCLSFDPHGRIVATGSMDSTVGTRDRAEM